MTSRRSATTASDKLQSLQVLRAVAATSVVYFHTLMSPHFGSFGVELFFVLSGLVISMVAESSLGWGEFLSNRLTRIAPAYWILTTAQIAVAAAMPGLLNSTTVNAGNYFKSIFFIPYFKENGSLTPILPVGWTLNYEMLFYALAAVSIAAAKNWFFTATTACVVAVWVIGHHLPPTTAAGLFLRSDELLEFILGMIAWRCRNLAMLQRIPALVAICAIVMLYAVMAWFEASHTFTKSLGQVTSLAAYGLPSFCIVLLALRLDSTLQQRVSAPVVRLLTHIGDASYATYLSHLFVIECFRKIVARGLPGLAPDGAVGAAIAVAASLLVGSATYVLIDKPGVRYARMLAKGVVRRRLGTVS